jgi:predicted glutamine amidotransferase
MFFLSSKKPVTLHPDFLKRFIASCHWRYFRKYNILGHHGLGWGFAYLSANDKLIIKRDLTPIYYADFRSLSKIKTRFLLVHARKSYPWHKKYTDIHPIDIGKKYCIVHNGVIKNASFPPLKDPNLNEIAKNTSLDTRKYLCSILDGLSSGNDLKATLESLFRDIQIAAGANAFLFNSQECNVITHHNSNFNGRHHTLFLARLDHLVSVSTTPIVKNSKEVENDSLIRIDLKHLSLKFEKLQI